MMTQLYTSWIKLLHQHHTLLHSCLLPCSLCSKAFFRRKSLSEFPPKFQVQNLGLRLTRNHGNFFLIKTSQSRSPVMAIESMPAAFRVFHNLTKFLGKLGHCDFQWKKVLWHWALVLSKLNQTSWFLGRLTLTSILTKGLSLYSSADTAAATSAVVQFTSNPVPSTSTGPGTR